MQLYSDSHHRVILGQNRRGSLLHHERGMTLGEILIAMGLMGMMFVGIFSMTSVSRRLTEAAVYQNAATTVMQGYIEQMKNMDYAELYLSPAAGTATTGSYGTTATYIIPTRKTKAAAAATPWWFRPCPSSIRPRSRRARSVHGLRQYQDGR